MIKMSKKQEYFLRWLLDENRDEDSPLFDVLGGKEFNDIVHFADLNSYGKEVGDDINATVKHLDYTNGKIITKCWKEHIKELTN